MTAEEQMDVDALFQENVRHVQRQGLRLEPRPRNEPSPAEEAANADAWSKLAAGVTQVRTDQKRLREDLAKETADRQLHDSIAARQRERAERLALEREEDSRRLWASLDAISERLCGLAVDGEIPREHYMEWLIWRNGNYLAFGKSPGIVDLSRLAMPVSCAKFLRNQILVARRDGHSHSVVTFEWVAEVVRESYRRSHPRAPAPIVPPPAPVESSPDPYPYPDDSVSTPPPSIPHCRYHGWCQEPPKNRD